MPYEKNDTKRKFSTNGKMIAIHLLMRKQIAKISFRKRTNATCKQQKPPSTLRSLFSWHTFHITTMTTTTT